MTSFAPLPQQKPEEIALDIRALDARRAELFTRLHRAVVHEGGDISARINDLLDPENEIEVPKYEPTIDEIGARR